MTIKCVKLVLSLSCKIEGETEIMAVKGRFQRDFSLHIELKFRYKTKGEKVLEMLSSHSFSVCNVSFEPIKWGKFHLVFFFVMYFKIVEIQSKNAP